MTRRIKASGPARFLCVDKVAGPTSHDAVRDLRRITGLRKVGHAGTLDPFATGLLVCGLDAATRLLGLLSDSEKEYVAEVRFGVGTDSLDATGTVLDEQPMEVTPGTLEGVLPRFLGEQDQRPPQLSAIRVGRAPQLRPGARGRRRLRTGAPARSHRRSRAPGVRSLVGAVAGELRWGDLRAKPGPGPGRSVGRPRASAGPSSHPRGSFRSRRRRDPEHHRRRVARHWRSARPGPPLPRGSLLRTRRGAGAPGPPGHPARCLGPRSASGRGGPPRAWASSTPRGSWSRWSSPGARAYGCAPSCRSGHEGRPWRTARDTEVERTLGPHPGDLRRSAPRSPGPVGGDAAHRPSLRFRGGPPW